MHGQTGATSCFTRTLLVLYSYFSLLMLYSLLGMQGQTSGASYPRGSGSSHTRTTSTSPQTPQLQRPKSFCPKCLRRRTSKIKSAPSFFQVTAPLCYGISSSFLRYQQQSLLSYQQHSLQPLQIKSAAPFSCQVTAPFFFSGHPCGGQYVGEMQVCETIASELIAKILIFTFSPLYHAPRS
jgi:hypothetical protein